MSTGDWDLVVIFGLPVAAFMIVVGFVVWRLRRQR